MSDILSSIYDGLKELGKEMLKSIAGTPGDTVETASSQITGEEKSAEKIAAEDAEKKKKENQIRMNLHEQAQQLGVAQEKPQQPTDEETKAKEEEEKKKNELPPLEIPQGKTTGEVPVKRAMTQIEDKTGYKG